MRGLSVASIFASASGRVSEDAWGQVGDETRGAVWVLDGATGIGERQYISGAYSDAAWFAQELSAALTQHSLWPMAAREVLLLALRQVAKAWHDRVDEKNIPPYALPSAAGVWLRWDGEVQDCLSLGDCRAWHLDDNGKVTQLSAMGGEANDDWVMGLVRTQQAAGTPPHAMRAALTPALRAARSRMNQPGGYEIFSVMNPAVMQLPVRRYHLEPGKILLCSDGLLRWHDVYQQAELPEFVSSAVTDGPGLLAELRALENSDAACARFPRLKAQDDATGLVLRLV